MVRSPQEIANNSVDLVEALNENDLVDGVHNATQMNELISIDTNVSVNSSANKSPSPNGLGEKRKQHNCPYCDRSFTRPYRLNDHISFSHTDEKKYMCNICSKNFSCKDKLKHHIDVKHENKKPNVKTKSKAKNIEDLKCEYPGCTKTFANKYNVKRHIENVHLKVKRKLNKNSSSNCSLANNSDSNQNNISHDLNSKTSQITSSTNVVNTSLNLNHTITQAVNPTNDTKIEPASTPDKQTSSCIINKNGINQQPLNLNNSSPLTLVATSNGIGGITLTTLGSIHQSQLGNSQNNNITPLNLASLNGNGNTTFLTLNSTPLIIQPNQPQLIYQPSAIQVIPNNSLETNTAQNNANNGMMIKNSNINLNCLNSMQSNTTDATNLNSSVTINDANSIVTLNSNFGQNGPDLVNSILIKSEQQENSLVQDCHSLINFSDLDNNHNETEQIHASFDPNEPNNDVKMLIKDECDNTSQQGDEEKDGKIYTCARCPEMFNSAKQLRKHVSENHEKGFVLYNMW